VVGYDFPGDAWLRSSRWNWRTALNCTGSPSVITPQSSARRHVPGSGRKEFPRFPGRISIDPTVKRDRLHRECGRTQYPAHLEKVPIRARASLRIRPGCLEVDLEPGTLEKIRTALISRRAQNPLQDHSDIARAMLGDGLEHLAIVLAVELRQCGQG
jgi:hypothetical protein